MAGALTPATAFVLTQGETLTLRGLCSRFLRTDTGNFAINLALPRDKTLKIFCNDEYQKKGKVNDEAEVALVYDASSLNHQWRFMGSTGLVACAGAMLAEKHCSADDKKLLNGTIAAVTLTNVGLWMTNDTMSNEVKPPMRALNIASNLAVGAFALKEALGK